MTESLVAYLSPAEIDAFLLTCTEYCALGAVWRMRWQRDQVDAAPSWRYVSEEGPQRAPATSVGGGGGEVKSPDGDGDAAARTI